MSKLGPVGVPTISDKLSGYVQPTENVAPLDLHRHCESVEAYGLDSLVLKVAYTPTSRGPRGRVRVYPGVLGDVIGSSAGCLFVSVTTKAIRLALKRKGLL